MLSLVAHEGRVCFRVRGCCSAHGVQNERGCLQHHYLSMAFLYPWLLRSDVLWAGLSQSKAKSSFLFRMKHGPCLTTLTHAHTFKTPHRQSRICRYLPEGDERSLVTHLYCVVVAGFIIRILLACGEKRVLC